MHVVMVMTNIKNAEFVKFVMGDFDFVVEMTSINFKILAKYF